MTDTSTPHVQTEVAPALPFTMRSTQKEYFKRFGVGRALLVLFLLAIIVIRFDPILSTATILGLALLIPFFGWRMLYKRSVTFTETAIEYNNGLWRTKTIPYSDVKELVGAIQYQDMTFGSIPRLTLSSQEDTQILSLYGLYWEPGDLNKASLILEKKGVKAQYIDAPISTFQFAQSFPSHATYYEKHPIKIALIVTFGLIIGITALVYLYDYFSDSFSV